MRAAIPLLVLFVSPSAWAQPATIAQAIRAADWPTAQALAAASPDPLAARLITYLRLLHPGGGQAAEITDFIAGNPGWPGQAVLLKRRDEALAAEPDDSVALAQCRAAGMPLPRSGAALSRCAEAAAAAGDADEAATDARAAWVVLPPDDPGTAPFEQRWHSVLTPADQAARFSALLALDPAQAAAQLPRLARADQSLARARLALRRNAADAGALIAALPPAVRADPDLVLDELRAARRADRDDEALALWNAAGFAAERAAGPDAAIGFWAERSQLARRRLRAGDTAAAYLLADDTGALNPEQAADAAFLAGFIALRRLKRPDLAAAHFAELAKSGAAISQARAHYWLARAAAAARGDTAGAQSEYAAAAAWPTTYYGQLAALALGDDTARLADRITAIPDLTWTAPQALVFAGTEPARAAAILVGWGEPGHARGFLQQIMTHTRDPAGRALVAQYALGLDLPDQAVAAARRAGRDGVILIGAGWPLTADPPDGPVPPDVALGLIRQESSFDPAAISPSGARGLMQLMPQTAAQVGRSIGATDIAAALTDDPAANMRLGTAYLRQLLDQFGGSLPLAIAAYNAGPNRVQQWLADNGDPRTGAVAMIDWIELIPFAETRNYVQRVIENITIYRAKRHVTLPYPVTP